VEIERDMHTDNGAELQRGCSLLTYGDVFLRGRGSPSFSLA
jgi:hypothetical protein